MYGERLRLLRKARELSTEEVANRLGMAKSSYAGYESETKKPPLDNLKRLAQMYDVSVDYILGLTDDPNPKPQEQRDMKEFLDKSNLHWNGKPLTDTELEPIRQLLEMVVRDRLPKMIQDAKNTPKKNKALE